MIFNHNQYMNIKPYRARNMMIKKTEVQPETEPNTDEVGYITVGVFTASGALPVPDAVVTIYHTYDEGEEHVLHHLITDESGRIPTIDLPVVYEGVGEQTEYFYSTYNLRVQAIGYYTANILDIQVFPNTSTDYTINLIPTAQGDTSESPERTLEIPPQILSNHKTNFQ